MSEEIKNEVSGTQESLENTTTPEIEEEEKLFTQSKLEELISERLKRERKTSEALTPVKQLLRELSDKGVLSGKGYKDMALELVQRLSVSSEKAKATEIETSVGKENPSEEEKAQVAPQASNQEELSDEAAERPDQTEGEQKSDGEMSVSLSDIASLTEEFPNVRIEEILGDKAFLEFAKHSKGNSLADCYSGYLSFLKTLPAKLRRSDGKASSTAFGAQGNAFGADYSQSLKKQQMDIAKSAGMSYREYCELMSSIPHGLRAAKSTNV